MTILLRPVSFHGHKYFCLIGLSNLLTLRLLFQEHVVFYIRYLCLKTIAGLIVLLMVPGDISRSVSSVIVFIYLSIYHVPSKHNNVQQVLIIQNKNIIQEPNTYFKLHLSNCPLGIFKLLSLFN